MGAGKRDLAGSEEVELRSTGQPGAAVPTESYPNSFTTF